MKPEEDLESPSEITKLLMASTEAAAQLDGYRELWAKDRNEQLEADRENLLQLLESASEVIGRFVSDEGWAQSDMDMMDAIDAKIASMRSKT